MEITRQTQVAEVATQSPATIKVFQRHGVDFCCGGKRALGEVCAEQALDFADLRAELLAAEAAPAPASPRLQELALDALTSHIVERYHAYLREELPRLEAMMAKVLRVHGERHPELAEVSRTFQALRDDLVPHLMKEEQALFPFVAHMAELDASGQPLASVPFGTVQNPVRMMEYEHEAVGGLLKELRALSGGYTPPADACNTFRGLYHGLLELERDTHEHIHVENNILHPRAVEMEARLASLAVR